MIEKFIMAGRTALHVCDSQQGERCVVLLHGYLESMFVWDDFVPLLYKRVRVVTLDLPGHGISEVRGECHSMEYLADVVRDALQALGIARCTLVGHSMGGYVAMDIQRLYPETVAGLALCDTMAASDGVGGENRLKMADAAEQTNSVEPVMHFAQPADGDSTVKKTPEFIATMTGWINEQNPAGLAWRQRMTYGRPELGAVPETISAPSLVVSGELDPSSNPSVMRPLAERITGAEFIDIPDCGHFSAVEHPDTVARALLSLVKRVQSAQKNA